VSVPPEVVAPLQERDELCVTLLRFVQGHESPVTGSAGVLDFIRRLWRNVEIKPPASECPLT
jgi:hypothetical protein